MSQNNISLGIFLLRYWWVWPLAFLLLIVLQLLDMLNGHFLPNVIDNVIWGIILLLGVLQVVAFILSIAHKAWWKLGGIMAGGFLCALGFAAIVFVGMVTVLFEEEEDHFGMEHPIPDTLQCEVPIGGVIMQLPEDSCSVAADSDSIRILSTDKSTWLQLYEGGQPGIYEYTLYAPALPDGYVYLRCFEVTKDIALSTKEIVKRTKHEFSDHTSFGKVVDKRDFTIYEGVWGEPYAVRVEVWCHDNASRRDKCLLSKVYKLEGWMR